MVVNSTRGHDSPPCVLTHTAPPFWELQWRSHRLRHCVMKNEREKRCWLAAYTRSRHESQVADQLHVKELNRSCRRTKNFPAGLIVYSGAGPRCFRATSSSTCQTKSGFRCCKQWE